jgi:short-subunit dehydrogenase
VAGASEGLGAAWSHGVAARGLNVLMLARRPELLEETARAVRERHGVEVRTAAMDLAAAELPAQLERLTEGVEVGFAVYNAAYSAQGPFLELPLIQQLLCIDVNVKGPVTLAHVLGGKMAARGRGALVVMSSITAFQGSPYISTYGATKAFNLNFGEGLWFELSRRGVDVLACAAGAVKTPSLLRASPQGEPGMIEPEQVVAEALATLGRAPMLVPGRFNRFATFFMRRVMTRRMAVGILGNRTVNLRLPE